MRQHLKKGQRAALALYTRIALICYVGVLALLVIWNQGNPATMLSLKNINMYTIIFIICYAIGYGAYYSTADMPIPMVADCSDYETYRSGNYVPGIMGTLFSLVDKLVSSLGSTIVGLAVMLIGIETLPDTKTPYLPGMKWVVIVLFCILPMIAWILTQYAMHRYSLSGERMKEIQSVNAVRKHAMNEGMSMEEAMHKWQTIEDVPKEFRQN
ncbi:MAG: MFS transporter [Lachnospiraceae bacterium]|nr:MFS transporter [Lachnospiraceae bacterium]